MSMAFCGFHSCSSDITCEPHPFHNVVFCVQLLQEVFVYSYDVERIAFKCDFAECANTVIGDLESIVREPIVFNEPACDCPLHPSYNHIAHLVLFQEGECG